MELHRRTTIVPTFIDAPVLRQCPTTGSNNAFGCPPRPRIVQIQFNNTIPRSGNQPSRMLPDPLTGGPVPENPSMNYEHEDVNYPRIGGRQQTFWNYVHEGGTGQPGGFGNFDVALCTDQGDWLHGTDQGKGPQYNSTEELDDQFTSNQPGARFSFNSRLFCVVCEESFIALK